jgi:hypothetical protein
MNLSRQVEMAMRSIGRSAAKILPLGIVMWSDLWRLAEIIMDWNTS